MAEDSLTYNPEWIGGDWDADTSVLDVLDTLGSSNPGAVGALDKIFTTTDTVDTDSAGNPIVEGITALSEYEPSQRTLDQIAPAIAIGGYETVKGIAKGLNLPEGLAAKTRAGGIKAISYDLAIHAGKAGADVAQSIVGAIAPGTQLSPTAETAVGLGTGVAAYKGVPKIAKSILGQVKTGMVSDAVTGVLIEAGESAMKESVRPGFGPRNLIVQDIKRQTQKEVSKQLTDEVKKRIGSKAAEGWDDVLMRLKNPTVANRVGRLLANVAPKTAAKLAASATATVFPELVSTAFGLAGMAWTAYDIFNLAKQMPELHSMIFEDAPTEVVEDTIMNQMSAEESIFPPDEQRTL